MRAKCIALAGLTLGAAAAYAQQGEGKFILHKFANAIGAETYTLSTSGDRYTLSSHFLFRDRGEEVPLEATFVAHTGSMSPVSYLAKGKAARLAAMDDQITVADGALTVIRDGKQSSLRPAGPWWIADGYSPVAMQEQMMRWWLTHGRPGQFTAYPSGAEVRIAPAETLHVRGAAAHGYTVEGLIWGQESLWMSDDGELLALVSTDAEFDHFEAVREPYESELGTFISAAVRAELEGLKRLSERARSKPARTLAIVGATLEDGSGRQPVADSVILMHDGVIVAAGARAAVPVPAGASVLDAHGKWAIPGLWDMHAHYEQVEWGPIYLASGVTSVRDVGNEFDFIRTLRAELDRKQDPALGPHLEFAGVVDGSGPIAIGATRADTPAQAREWVARYKEAGARQIKIYSSVKPEMVKAICAEAHAQGMTITGHIPEGMTAVDGVQDGMDQINHIQYALPYFSHPELGADGKPDRTRPPVFEPEGERAKQLQAVLQAHGTVLDPTVALFEIILHTGPLDTVEPGVDHLPPQLREALDTPGATGSQATLNAARWAVLLGTLRELHKAGIPIVAGTDQGIPGYSLHRELELYVEAGFTPAEALETATINAARALGVERESGSIEPGKRGDVLLLDADPLLDIHNTRRVWRTVAAGAVYEPGLLWESMGFRP